MNADLGENQAQPSGWPERFRKLTMQERRELLRARLAPEPQEWGAISCAPELAELADIMVESAAGCLPLPLGIATGFLIDGVETAIPMAVEEPSVIAAACFAARLLRHCGGLQTWATEPVMRAQLFLEGVPLKKEAEILAHEQDIRAELDAFQASLKSRGGGFRRMEACRLSGTRLVRVDLLIDVRDAMGANILNSAAERVRPLLERISGGRGLMCILSNASAERRAAARFALPVERLGAAGAGDYDGAEVARRLVLAADLAQEDPERAITHNKGIMNGISALAQATMNDTRAIEAAAHAWAARDGRYRGLSRYSSDGKTLEGSLELPLAFGSVGGAVGFHPASRFSLKVLGRPDARRLARIAAALGLAQNLAALLALVTGGIQRGHMKYHCARLAYQAGARGEEIRRVAETLAQKQAYTLKEAASELEELRRGGA